MAHFEAPGLIQHITFRLHDALSDHALTEMKRELAYAKSNERARQLRICIEKYIDAGHGSCILSHPEAAALVENALLHFDQERYRLLAWVIMPNHVHVLIEQFDVCGLGKIVQYGAAFACRMTDVRVPKCETGKRPRFPASHSAPSRYIIEQTTHPPLLSPASTSFP
jgi:hypothetical protein